MIFSEQGSFLIMHRVFCTDIPDTGGYAVPDSREAEHLFKVLRARDGEFVEILDGKGCRAQAVVENKRLLVTAKEVIPEPEEKLHLCCALPRKQKLDQLLKQAAELGVWSIRPVRCMRSVAEGGPRERWDLLLREACKQSGNPFLPVVEKEEKLPDALKKLQQENIKIYYGSITPLEHGGGSASAKAVVIGPEGGFAPEELQMMEKCDAQPLNLGPYVLRLETAAVCALAVLRKLSAVLILLFTVFLAGCSCSDDNAALLTKGKSLLESGDAAGARECFRKAIAKNPEDPNGYIALAKVCDENLDEPLEAIYAYEMYLKVVPPNADGRVEAENAIVTLRNNAVKKFGAAPVSSVSDVEFQALKEECETLRATVSSAKAQLENQIRIANQLRKQLRERK